MLQQIIKDMYIEPDLLAELSDDQKQLIFIKIREEQVRRWTEFESKLEKQTPIIKPPKKTDHTVQFLLGADQNPWVWVMGEHDDDKSVDEILEEEARAKASKKAEKEAELLREKEEREAEQKLREEEQRLEKERLEQERILAEAAAAAKQREIENAQRLKQTEKEAQIAKQQIAKLKLVEQEAPVKLRRPLLCRKHSSTEGQTSAMNSSGNIVTPPASKVVESTNSQTIEFDGEIFELTSPKLPCDVKTCRFCFEEKSEKARLIREESYRVLKEKRTSEIMTAFQKTRSLWEQKAKEDDRNLHQVWQQQERKAKQAETKLRQLVKSAREDYKRNSTRKSGERVTSMGKVFRESAVLLGNVLTATKPSKSARQSRPVNREEVLKWFIEEEKLKNTGLTESNTVEPWFHGMISREEAETMLSDSPEHSFLVRVSEKIWGYAISYKSEDRCKHYLVDSTDNGGYQFFGTNQLEHLSLAQLLQYHKNHPISTAGQELLKLPVAQTKTPPDYANLFPELLETTSL